MVVPVGSIATPAPVVGARSLVVLGIFVAVAVAATAVPAVAVAGRVATLDVCLAAGERGSAGDSGFAMSGPNGRSFQILGARLYASP
ncbi:MAG: hypothetical protein HYU87_11835 [Chloroflexi bacterium]|nr:hypothetical protein [Chloroflexota bacterium]